MKNTITIIFVLIAFYAKADTISTWKVYYNAKLIAEFSEVNNQPEIVFDSDKYKPGDYLSIQYNDDMPCSDCSYEILINTENDGQEVWFNSFKNKYKPIKIGLENLVWEPKTDQLPMVIVYLVEIDKTSRRRTNKKLFDIKIQ